MKVRQPKVKTTLIKTRARDVVGANLAAVRFLSKMGTEQTGIANFAPYKLGRPGLSSNVARPQT